MEEQTTQIGDQFIMGALEQSLAEERRRNLLLTAMVNQQQAQIRQQGELTDGLSARIAELEAFVEKVGSENGKAQRTKKKEEKANASAQD